MKDRRVSYKIVAEYTLGVHGRRWYVTATPPSGLAVGLGVARSQSRAISRAIKQVERATSW